MDAMTCGRICTGWAIAIAGLGGCFSEEPGGSASDTNAGSTDGTASSSGAPTTGSSSVTTVDTSSSGTVDDSGSTDAGSSDTTETAGTCVWPLQWDGGARKDVIVVQWSDPGTASAPGSDAVGLASDDGVRIALISRQCSPEYCGPSPGYEWHALSMAATDLVEAIDAVSITRGFLRPRVPLHIIVITTEDMAVSSADLAAHPLLSGAQIDVRVIDDGACGQVANLEMLAQMTHGSFRCEFSQGGGLVQDVVDQMQPECELFGNPAELPPPGPQTMTLGGFREAMPVMSMPDGPGPCGNDPAVWSIVDGPLGHLELCPAACRDVGDWHVDDLMAAIQFPC